MHFFFAGLHNGYYRRTGSSNLPNFSGNGGYNTVVVAC